MEEEKSIQPSADYLAKVAVPSQVLPLSSSRRQLLILDLNGTLVSRSRRRHEVFARPYYESFFDYIFANFTVMVWSSATEHSVNRMCKIFDPKKYMLPIIWHRQHFNLNKTDFYSNRETLKDLDYVWRQMPEFDATNTIILDDTPAKVACQPYNLIQISTFHHEPVLKREKRDQDLCKVANYLRILRLQSNVSNFICNNPFDLRMDWGIIPNDILDFIVVVYSKKGKSRIANPSSPLPAQLTSSTTSPLLPLNEKSSKALNDPEPDYIPLESPSRQDNISSAPLKHQNDIPLEPPKKTANEKRKIRREKQKILKALQLHQERGRELGSKQETERAYPLSNKRDFSTVRSPSPPFNSKKINVEVKTEKMDDKDLFDMCKLETEIKIEPKPEKPPIRASTRVALQNIKRNIRQRRRRASEKYNTTEEQPPPTHAS
jgi:hypothetical protein